MASEEIPWSGLCHTHTDSVELASRLRPLLHKDQAVFVDFADAVPWHEVVATVDTVRGIGTSLDRDGVHVAVRMRDE